MLRPFKGHARQRALDKRVDKVQKAMADMDEKIEKNRTEKREARQKDYFGDMMKEILRKAQTGEDDIPWYKRQ